ncbi:MAG: YitT family protein [Salinivirgaceae bacterium]|nr:YitT family protein [Salinivirgaceae bacterium]
MAFIHKEKPFSKNWFISWSLITLGAFIMAAGFVLFINPYNIVPGGVYGISIVVHHLTKGVIELWPEGIPIGLFGLVLNIPLTILGIKILGPRFGVKTVIGFVLTSVFMDLLTMFIGENDPLGLADELLLSCIFGAVMIGLGLGLIFKSKATSGGSDIIAMIFAKYTKMPIGQLLIYVDSVIVLLGLVVFKDWKIPLYSWLVIYITGKVIDMVVEGVSYEKMLLIVSDKPDEIRDKIINDINRGGTFIMGEGMFNNQPKKLIYTVVSRREMSLLEDFIQKTDPNAFLTVVDAKEILGNGFKSLNDKITD